MKVLSFKFGNVSEAIFSHLHWVRERGLEDNDDDYDEIIISTLVNVISIIIVIIVMS